MNLTFNRRLHALAESTAELIVKSTDLDLEPAQLHASISKTVRRALDDAARFTLEEAGSHETRDRTMKTLKQSLFGLNASVEKMREEAEKPIGGGLDAERERRIRETPPLPLQAPKTSKP